MSIRRSIFTLTLSFIFYCSLAQPAYVYHDKGMDLLNAGKYAEAIKEFDAAIKKQSDDFESYTDRGRAQAALGKHDLAIADYSQAVKFNPNYYQAYYYRGMSYLAAAKDQLALADFTKVIGLSPAFADGYVKRGLTYYKIGQADNAIKDLNKAVEMKIATAEVFFTRGEILRGMGKDDMAIKDYNNAINIMEKPEVKADAGSMLMNAYFSRGLLHDKKKKHAEAVADYTKAIENKMNTEAVYASRAAAYIAMGNKEGAVKDYSTLIDVFKTKDANAYTGRGMAYSQKGDYTNAVKDLSKSLALKKDDPLVLTERGNAYLKQGKGKYPLATNDFNKALELQPNNFIALYGLGKISFESNKFDQGIEYLTKALKIKPDADAHYMRSMCNHKAGNKNAVCEDLQKAASLGHTEAKRDVKAMGCM
jgi:tetratricopeptide (TPR) repeat protein